MDTGVSIPRWVLLAGVGAVVAAVGSVLPWVTLRFDSTLAALASVPKTRTVSGLDGDGTITLVLAVVTLAGLVAAVLRSRPGPKTAAVTALTGTLVTTVAVVDYREFRATRVRIQRRVAGSRPETGADAVTLDIEPGLAVLGLGGLLLLVAGSYALLSYWRDDVGSAVAAGE